MLLLAASCASAAPADAATGTWNLNPLNGDWNEPSNWSSRTVPNGPMDVAVFGLSAFTSVFLSANTEVEGMVFNAGASGYTITVNPTRALTISGAGLVNISGTSQTLVAGVDPSGAVGSITFTNRATVGSSTTLISNGSLARNADGATIAFRNASSPGEGTLRANGSPVDAGRGGTIKFFETSSAGRADLTANPGAVSGGHWGAIHFYDKSTAAQAIITTKGGFFGGNPPDVGGTVTFHNEAIAAESLITNQAGSAAGAGGGGTGFLDNSSAGTATIINNGGASDFTYGGSVGFANNSSAGNSLIVNNGGKVPISIGGSTRFSGSSSAGAATLIANAGKGQGPQGGGWVEFDGDSTGGTARLAVFGNAFLDIRQHNAPGLTIGSLKGQVWSTSALTTFRLAATTQAPSSPE